MTSDIYLALMNLKSNLKDDERIKNLSHFESELENNDEVKILSYQLDNAVREYNDMLKIYPLEHELSKAKQKIVYEKKKQLDQLDVVKKYNKAYKEVKEIYDEINDNIFHPLSPSLCNKRN